MNTLKLLFPFLVLLAAACEENPDERTLIDEPRLLAVQADPPALRGFDGVVRLSALAIDSTGATMPDGAVRYRVCSPWQFLINPDQDCPANEALWLDSRELTTQSVLGFYPPPEGLAPADGAGMTRSEGCGETPLAEVPIVAEMVANGDSYVTVKRIPVYADDVRKQNPDLGEIEIVEVVDDEHRLRISVDDTSLDIECRDDVEQLEALRIHAYSTSGSFESATVDIVPTIRGVVEPAEIVWTAGDRPAILLFVAIDRDGGIDWKLLSI